MTSNKLNVKGTCPECKHTFYVYNEVPSNENNLNESKLQSEWLTINGKSYRLTWYDCPSCGCRIFVQGDDWRTERLLRKCIETVAKMKDKRSHRFDNAKKQSEYLKKLRKDLAESRKRVENEVSGKSIIDRITGNKHLVVFRHE